MMMRRNTLLFAAAVAAVLLLWFALGSAHSDVPGSRSGAPGLVDNSLAVIQGIVPERLETTSIPADFLWGAGKFGAFSVSAPADSSLVLEQITARRIGGSDEVMPSVWLRLNRQRIYTEVPIRDGNIDIKTFPPSVIENGYVVEDTVIDDVAHRVVKNPPDAYALGVGESVVVELFGNINADAVTRAIPVSFCLDAVYGTLMKTGEKAQSRLNETCWEPTTILPVPKS